MKPAKIRFCRGICPALPFDLHFSSAWSFPLHALQSDLPPTGGREPPAILERRTSYSCGEGS